MIACTAILAAALAAQQPAEVELAAKDKPLTQILADLADACDAGLLIRREASQLVTRRITIDAERVPWIQAAQLLCDGYGLDLALVGDRLVVSDAKASLQRRQVQHVYDVRHLVADWPARPGPELGIPEPGSTGSRLLPPVEPSRIIEDLPTLLVERIGPGLSSGQMTLDGGMLTITAQPEIHERIPAAIKAMELARARQVVARLWRLPAEPEMTTVPAEACAALLRGLPAPALVAVMMDEQQNHAWSGTERRIVSDLDVVQQVYDPIISLVLDGLVLDCVPQVTDAGVVATLRPGAATTGNARVRTVAEADGKPVAGIDELERSYATARETRIIPLGGGTVIRLGDAVYLLQMQVVEP